MENKIEVWQRGPILQVPDLLQPVAHALLQAREDVEELTENFPENLLWQKPGSVAAVGFHLQHLTGVLDRLFTYARGQSLNADQLEFLRTESNPDIQKISLVDLKEKFFQQVNIAIQQLIATDTSQLTNERFVGRAQIPSTLLGLLFHAAEHTQRHVGQLLVTIRILQNS